MPAKKKPVKKVVKKNPVKKKVVKKKCGSVCKAKKSIMTSAALKKLKAYEKKALADIKIAKSKMIKAEQDVKKFAKTHPERAALIAAGVGAAIGTAITLAIKKSAKKPVKKKK